tara:strand:- start:94948 stop:95259 length:312 start_codon:yes stop_codon:yes gene_type:complete
MSLIDRLGKKLDKTSVGVIFALVLPIISFIIFWQVKYGQKDVEQLYYYMTLNSANRNDLMIFPLLPNMVIFYLTNFQWRWDKFTVGLVATTIILAVPTVIALL